MGLPVTLDQHGVVQTPPLVLRGSGGVIGLASVPQQQPPSLMPLLAYANYAMGSPQVVFFFRVEPPTICIFYVGVCFVVCFLLLGTQWDAVFTYGSQPLGFAPLQPFGIYPQQAYVKPGDGHQSMPGMHRVAAPSTTLSRGSLLPLSQLFPNHPICMVGYTAFGAWQRVIQSLHIPYMMGRGLLFQVWCHQMTQSTLNL